MNTSAVDVPALILAILVAALIAAVLLVALRDGNARRGWIVAGVLTVVLALVGIADLMRASPRETALSTVVLGVAVPVLGTLGLVRGTRRVRPGVRWLLAWLTAFVLLIGGLQLGVATARWLPF